MLSSIADASSPCEFEVRTDPSVKPMHRSTQTVKAAGREPIASHVDSTQLPAKQLDTKTGCKGSYHLPVLSGAEGDLLSPAAVHVEPCRNGTDDQHPLAEAEAAPKNSRVTLQAASVDSATLVEDKEFTVEGRQSLITKKEKVETKGSRTTLDPYQYGDMSTCKYCIQVLS